MDLTIQPVDNGYIIRFKGRIYVERGSREMLQRVVVLLNLRDVEIASSAFELSPAEVLAIREAAKGDLECTVAES